MIAMMRLGPRAVMVRVQYTRVIVSSLEYRNELGLYFFSVIWNDKFHPERTKYVSDLHNP